MKGKVIKYDQNNINTDLIIPARYLVNSEPKFLAEHCMEDLDPEFNQKIREMHLSIMVGGSNFGSGSSREQAPLAIKTAGIKCVLAPSFARIFFRNAINIGLPILEFADLKEVNTGDELEINFEEGKILNLTLNKEFIIKQMPAFLHKIISSEGLIKYARKQVLNN